MSGDFFITQNNFCNCHKQIFQNKLFLTTMTFLDNLLKHPFGLDQSSRFKWKIRSFLFYIQTIDFLSLIS